MSEITWETLLKAYALGVFPMGERADDPTLYWIDPEQRGVLPLDAFHIPKRLARTVRQDVFEVRVDTAFDAVMRACAAPEGGPSRRQTWINAPILELYGELHRRGRAHSVECWRDGALAGGLYGVSLGAAFFGESMFNRARDASKVALVHLVARLIVGGYELLDTQFVTEHLRQFGAREIPRATYRKKLRAAMGASADFYGLDGLAAGPDGSTGGASGDMVPSAAAGGASSTGASPGGDASSTGAPEGPTAIVGMPGRIGPLTIPGAAAATGVSGSFVLQLITQTS